MVEKRKIPPSEWTVERPYDSADYLDGPPPRYASEAETAAFRKKQRQRILKKGQTKRPPEGPASS